MTTRFFADLQGELEWNVNSLSCKVYLIFIHHQSIYLKSVDKSKLAIPFNHQLVW